MMESIFNFRDLGNVPTSCGKVKEKIFIRGGALNNISDSDLHDLKETYHLDTIIDFRDTNELETKPDVEIANTKYIHLNVIGQNEVTANPVKMAKDAQRQQDGKYMEVLYENFVHYKSSSDCYRQFIDIIKEHDKGSIYFHCSAGKDRTGFAAYILLRILGATDEEAMAEYMRSNDVSEEQLQVLIKDLTEAFKGLDPDTLRSFLGVKTEYLQSSIDAIKELYGDFDTYRKEALNVSDEDVKFLQAKYCE